MPCEWRLKNTDLIWHCHTETQCQTHNCCQHHRIGMHVTTLKHNVRHTTAANIITLACMVTTLKHNVNHTTTEKTGWVCLTVLVTLLPTWTTTNIHLPACHITYLHAISPTCMPYHLPACHITYLHAISIKCSVPHACRNVLSVELPLIHTIHGSLPIGPGQTAVGRPGLQSIMKNSMFWDLNGPSTAQGCLRTTYIF